MPAPSQKTKTSPRANPWEKAVAGVLEGSSPTTVLFQPIVDLKRGKIAGYEALARFPGDESPEVWFRQAERLGRGEELERFVLRKAVESRDRLPPKTFLSVNVTPSFLSSGYWDDFLSSVPDLERLVVEVSEQQAISDYEVVKGLVSDIRKRGGKFAIDDVGSGYASLQHVLELRPDFVKLDRAFVTNCAADAAKNAVIGMLRQFAEGLNAGVIAEGLETQEELAALMRLETPLAQGFLLGRPESEWSSLDPVVSLELLSLRFTPEDRYTIGSFVEPIPTVATEEEATRLLIVNPGRTEVAVVDRNDQLLSLLDRDPAEGIRLLDRPLIVKETLDANEVLASATERDAEHRFDPVAITDVSGRFTGIARVETLIRALLKNVKPQGA